MFAGRVNIIILHQVTELTTLKKQLESTQKDSKAALTKLNAEHEEKIKCAPCNSNR